MQRECDVSSSFMESDRSTSLYKVRTGQQDALLSTASSGCQWVPVWLIPCRRGSVTQAMYEYWLEAVILPQCEPFPGKRSIVVMDNCSTHHSNKITQLGERFGVHLLYLPPYSPHLNPIELTFHLLKQWLRRWRDLAPKPEDLEAEDYKKAWILHLEQAVAWVLKEVDVRNLFVCSQVPSNLMITAARAAAGDMV
ncbi:hypothetical protein E4T45_07781 [Aureobasidium sp. EXF-8846]|nr:hypothetical protein E4T45_07781 [Aureobasidium sp. EXF-8846]